MTTLQDILASAVPLDTPDEAAQRELAAEHERQHAEQDERQALVAKFAAVLCCCRPWYEHGSTDPPQVGCPVHGYVMVNPCSGAVYLPGMPPPGRHEHG